MTAQLAFINVDIAKHTGATDPLFKGVFSVDLHDAGGPDCTAGTCDARSVDDGAFIDLSKIKDLANVTEFVTPVLSATASIDWDVKATTAAGAALPGIGTEFLLHWAWSSANNPNGADPSSGKPDVLQFKNVRIDPGTFIDSVLGEIVKQIVTVYKPVQPILDTVQAPLPVLSDLSRAVGGGDVSIETLAKTFNTLADGPDIDAFLQVLGSIRALANSLSGECNQPGDNQDFCVVVGSFDLDADIAKTQQNTPDLATTPGFINPIASSLPSSSPIAQLDARSQGDLVGTGADSKHPGFKFPALEKPEQIFQLVLGHDVTLATFDSGPLALGFTFSQSFGPVYAPPPVNVVISGSAGVNLRIAAGFDTYGSRKAVENGKADASVLEGLYFQTTDDSGHPLPVVQFTGSIAAGAEVSAIVVKVGVAGGITLTVSFYWHDPDNDAKFRFGEFLAAALNNPICLFDVGGELSLFVKVYITIGIDPFSTSFDFTLVKVKLLDFNLKPDCNPTPPRLGGVSGKTLYIYAGKQLGTTGIRGERWDSQNTAKESWVIREKVDNGTKTVTVAGLGITHVFTQDIDTVVFDARGYQGELSVLFQSGVPDKPFDLGTIVFGGDGPDTIRTGSGPSFVGGGGGPDRITTGDRPDPGAVDASAAPKAVVAGGGGDDVITTGNAQDWVAGDGALTFEHHDQTADLYDTTLADISNNNDTGDITLPDVVDPATVGHPQTVDEVTGNADPALNDGADLITVGIGGSTIWGSGGGDKIGTAQATTVADANSSNARYTPGSNTIIGGSGGDQISSGSASDFIYTGSKEETGPDTEGSADGLNTVDTGSGNDTVYGSQGEDDVTVHSKTSEHATIFGGGGTDILDGGDGADKIYGGPDDDYLIAQPAGVDKKSLVQDQLGKAYKVTELPENPPSTSDKTLVGGGGSDRVYGGDGTSTIFGDHDTYFDDKNKQQNDPCVSPGPAASNPPVEHPNTGVTPGSNPPQADAKQADAADLILGGNGVDTIQAGGGGDFVFAFGSSDTVCGEGGGDTIDGGGGTDSAWAGSGNDTVYGQGAADNLYGNDGGDTIYGGDQSDTVEGNDGVDHLFGGEDADVVVGGTRFAGRADDGDFVYGDRGTDKLIGDNGTVTGDVVTVYDLPTQPAADGGEDLVYGGDENDRAYGGLENDRVFGGKGDDYIEGNNGSDKLYGESDQDDIIGGSSQVPAGDPTDANVTGMPDEGDFIYGGGNADAALGDNGFILRTGTPSPLTTARYDSDAAGAPPMTPRAITPYDLGDTPAAGTSGGDLILGQGGGDVILGQGGNDRIQGNEDGDYAEGGQGTDWIEGNAGNDDLVGGSSSPFSADPAQGQKDSYDVVFGGSGDDLLLGDNAVVTRSGTPNPLTKRIGTAAAPIPGRAFTLLDLAPGNGPGGAPTRGVYGADLLSGGGGVDVVLGQDGGDRISGGANDDYAEGNGGPDRIWGDALLAESLITHPVPDWPASSEDRQDTDTPNGQDDLMGGSSTQAFRDANDVNQKGDELHGNGESDFELGDNGTIVRDIVDGDGNVLPYTADLTTAKQPLSNRVYELRYPLDANGNPPAGAAYIRHSRPGTDATRFCAAGGSACEPTTAFGNDSMWGDAGDDFMYGQDGNDTMLGGTANDDMYGELGNDTMYGEQGEDAMLGDRGGVLDVFERGATPLVHAVFNQVPKIDFTGKRPGTLSRNVDLLHDVDGDAFTTRPFPHGGVLEGGIDHMRGSDDHDSMHGAFGDDLMNGDSGGDALFGDDGADVIWGGRGSTDPNNPNDRGTDDSYVDYLIGGKGATSGPSIAGALGSDILDWRPRGSYTPGTGCTNNPWPATVGNQTVDPCDWFVMTNTDDDLPAVPSTDQGYPAYFASTVNNQHHQGIDWQYGGWDRDVLQADVADNGPNPGDRLIDWTGTYNLYTHCNAAYGGYNDVRQWSPDMKSFLTQWAWALGAGQTASDVTTSTASAFDELALVYQADNTAHGSGSAFPSTPGHFDTPSACGL